MGTITNGANAVLTDVLRPEIRTFSKKIKENVKSIIQVEYDTLLSELKKLPNMERVWKCDESYDIPYVAKYYDSVCGFIAEFGITRVWVENDRICACGFLNDIDYKEEFDNINLEECFAGEITEIIEMLWND